MNKFLLKVLIFTVLISVLLLYYRNYSSQKLNQRFGYNQDKLIENSFKWSISNNYDLLILGNSRSYRGIDPDLLDIPAYNFSYNNDAYHIMVKKLKELFKRKVAFNHLILDVDYFAFSFLDKTREYAYSKHWTHQTLKYSSIIKPFIYFFDELENFRGIEKTSIIVETIDTLRKNPEFDSFNGLVYQENGFLADTWHSARENDRVTRQWNMLDVQLEAFNEILELCEYHNIKVYMVMLPIRQNELKNYPKSVLNDFDAFFRSKTKKGIYYFDFGTDENFGIKDFSDISHMNGQGAEKVTRMINDSIKSKIN